jgi:hypothetical protein
MSYVPSNQPSFDMSPNIPSLSHNITFDNDSKALNRSSVGMPSKSAQNNNTCLGADKKPSIKYDLPFGGPSAVKIEDK